MVLIATAVFTSVKTNASNVPQKGDEVSKALSQAPALPSVVKDISLRVAEVYKATNPQIVKAKSTQAEVTNQPMYIINLTGEFQKENLTATNLSFSVLADGKKVWALRAFDNNNKDIWQEAEIDLTTDASGTNLTSATGDVVDTAAITVKSVTQVPESKNKSATSLESTDTSNKVLKEGLYQDGIIALLNPYIQKALDNYYDQYLTTSPSYSFDLIEILDITRPEGYHTFPITIRFQVQPYVGPHDIIGIDQITMKFGPDEGDVKVEKFEHIKSYYNDLPPNLKSIIKKSH